MSLSLSINGEFYNNNIWAPRPEDLCKKASAYRVYSPEDWEARQLPQASQEPPEHAEKVEEVRQEVLPVVLAVEPEPFPSTVKEWEVYLRRMKKNGGSEVSEFLKIDPSDLPANTGIRSLYLQCLRGSEDLERLNELNRLSLEWTLLILKEEKFFKDPKVAIPLLKEIEALYLFQRGASVKVILAWLLACPADEELIFSFWKWQDIFLSRDISEVSKKELETLFKKFTFFPLKHEHLLRLVEMTQYPEKDTQRLIPLFKSLVKDLDNIKFRLFVPNVLRITKLHLKDKGEKVLWKTWVENIFERKELSLGMVRCIFLLMDPVYCNMPGYNEFLPKSLYLLIEYYEVVTFKEYVNPILASIEAFQKQYLPAFPDSNEKKKVTAYSFEPLEGSRDWLCFMHWMNRLGSRFAAAWSSSIEAELVNSALFEEFRDCMNNELKGAMEGQVHFPYSLSKNIDFLEHFIVQLIQYKPKNENWKLFTFANALALLHEFRNILSPTKIFHLLNEIAMMALPKNDFCQLMQEYMLKGFYYSGLPDDPDSLNDVPEFMLYKAFVMFDQKPSHCCPHPKQLKTWKEQLTRVGTPFHLKLVALLQN